MTDTDWQPISTAPKDGSRVWVWGSHDIYSTPTYGHFVVTFSGDFPEGEKYWRWVVPGLTCSIDATHWMPLPQAPQTTTEVSLPSAGSNAADAAAQAERK